MRIRISCKIRRLSPQPKKSHIKIIYLNPSNNLIRKRYIRIIDNPQSHLVQPKVATYNRIAEIVAHAGTEAALILPCLGARWIEDTSAGVDAAGVVGGGVASGGEDGDGCVAGGGGKDADDLFGVT